MSKFKTGDKVVITNVKDHRSSYNGEVVTIKYINPNGRTLYKPNITHYGVDKPFVFWEDELVPYNDYKIVITTNGAETLARLYDGKKVVKTATAKCSPNDTFDFETGAKLAFARLMETQSAAESLKKLGEALKNFKAPHINFCVKTEPKYYNGKVVCVNGAVGLTVGKIYEFVDGKLKDDDGDLRPCPHHPSIRVTTLENDGWSSRHFIPFVE